MTPTNDPQPSPDTTGDARHHAIASRSGSFAAYIAIETAISALISAGMSTLFAMVFFGARHCVDPGSRAAVMDLIPQSFAVTLMSFLVPTLLTRRRIRSGRLARLAGTHRLPRNTYLRSALAGAVAACLCPLAYGLLGPLPGTIAMAAHRFIVAKALFGAVLAMALTPYAVRCALKDPR